MIPTGIVSELEFDVWKGHMANDKDHHGCFEYYKCPTTGEVWVRGQSGSHIAFIVRPD